MSQRFCRREACKAVLSNRTQSQNIYCSKSCWGSDTTAIKLEAYLRGEWNGSRDSGEISSIVRKFLLEESGYKCSQCAWDKINPVTGRCPVEIDHIDGDSENNVRSNLRVICPNCHSLTPTYKALNMTGRGTRSYRKKYNQFDLVPKQASLSKTKINSICKCGQKKDTSSMQCQTCRLEDIRSNLNYPPIEEMLKQVHKIGLTAYAVTFGKSANALKKHMINNGVVKTDLRIKREPKVVFCSSCKVQLTVDEVAKNWVRCTEHHLTTYEYPPLEEIIAGVRAMGHNKYAASIGVKYGSTVRKYLANRGIVI